MIISNIEIIPGYEIVEHYGIVEGSTVRSKNVARDMMAWFKNILGGELKGYTELLKESRKEALKRMIKSAEDCGANAILNVRFATSTITSGATEFLVYGTAVRVSK